MTANALYQIVFLRHGESEGNAQGMIQGQIDLPLTAKGLQQVQSLAKFWQQESVYYDSIISSPLTRARQTAEIISSALNCPIEFDPAWMERSFGNLEGQIFEEILLQKAPPDFFHPYSPVGGSGESMVDLYNRASLALQNLLRRPDGRYLVVSHGALLNMTLCSVFGVNPHTSPRTPRFHFQNTGYASFSFDPDIPQWRMLNFNANHHLNRLTTEDG